LEWKILLYFYDYFEYFTAIWYNVWPFGIICGHLLYCLHFGMFGPRKIWKPWSAVRAALAVWHSGHRVRLQNIRSRVRIPPGCKAFRS
jgi:hypothetical protein